MTSGQPPPPARLLYDGEAGDRKVIAGEGLDGDWEFWDDQSNPNLVAGLTSACAAFGRFSIRLQSQGQTGWGASMSLFFRAPPRPQPFDGRAYSGFSLYLAAGVDEPAPLPVRVSVSTMKTAWNGECESCVDNFGKVVVLQPRWTRYEFRFDELEQQGWGVPPASLALEEIVQIHIAMQTPRFDVWVDQVAFEVF